jgi:hypothetical protein
MSVEHYEQLRGAARERAMAQALASVRAEGLEPDADTAKLLREVAEGRLDSATALEQVLAEYRG